MGRLFADDVGGSLQYACKTCLTPLLNRENLFCKGFRGRHGEALVFYEASNFLTPSPPVARTLQTGRFSITNIYCKGCFAEVGWRYEEAERDSEKYKIGKFLIEKTLMRKCSRSMLEKLQQRAMTKAKRANERLHALRGAAVSRRSTLMGTSALPRFPESGTESDEDASMATDD